MSAVASRKKSPAVIQDLQCTPAQERMVRQFMKVFREHPFELESCIDTYAENRGLDESSRAIDFGYLALAINDATGDAPGEIQANTLMSIGNHTKDLAECRRCYDRALKILGEYPTPPTPIGMAKTWYADALLKHGAKEESMKIGWEALTYCAEYRYYEPIEHYETLKVYCDACAGYGRNDEAARWRKWLPAFNFGDQREIQREQWAHAWLTVNNLDFAKKGGA